MISSLLQKENVNIDLILKVLKPASPIQNTCTYGSCTLSWFNVDATAVLDNENKLMYYVVLLHDISRQKQVEDEQRKANRLKTEFITTISHELRTPLNCIMGSCSHLLHLINSNPGKTLDQIFQFNDFCETISVTMSSSQFLLTLVNNVIDIQKIEAGKMEAQNITFDLPGIIVKAVRACKPIASQKKIRILTFFKKLYCSTSKVDCNDSSIVCIKKFNIENDFENITVSLQALKGSEMDSTDLLPKYCIGDPEKLFQVVMNILSNSVKYSPSNSLIKVHISSFLYKSKTILTFSIHDQGQGISPEDYKKLFQRFSRLKLRKRSDKPASGSGLGLNICKRLLMIMNGDIWVRGNEDGIEGEYKELAELILKSEEDSVHEKWIKQYCKGYPEKFEGACFTFVVPVECAKENDTTCIKSKDEVDNSAILTRTLENLVFGHLRENQSIENINKSSVELDRNVCDSAFSLSASIVSLWNQLNLLVVEDNIINQKVLIKMINEILKNCIPFSIDVAENGLVALEKVDQKFYQVVFMDIQMPVMDGVEASLKICEKYPDCSKRPIIAAVTANAMKTDANQNIQRYFDYYLNKPLTITKIKSIFSKLGLPF
ncbi:CheY-like superfamily domain-containing protein [Rozella allomycis CSF55]|uniref:histidine kinase n=1 Tax=Rozella allomycis (strain CSF55) TaxID=988480 RepID=A0A075AUK7_ROZAC|nr:CheY-like superfamily domain-containing protein [Rozella allomycis CSF55]|eukprot:EPZ33976.1 CheY-like superfamily domain-containing protein [Rozella allomycis CSF55]